MIHSPFCVSILVSCSCYARCSWYLKICKINRYSLSQWLYFASWWWLTHSIFWSNNFYISRSSGEKKTPLHLIKQQQLKGLFYIRGIFWSVLMYFKIFHIGRAIEVKCAPFLFFFVSSSLRLFFFPLLIIFYFVYSVLVLMFIHLVLFSLHLSVIFLFREEVILLLFFLSLKVSAPACYFPLFVFLC